VKYHEDNSHGGHGWWLSPSHRQAPRYAGKSVIVVCSTATQLGDSCNNKGAYCQYTIIIVVINSYMFRLYKEALIKPYISERFFYSP